MRILILSAILLAGTASAQDADRGRDVYVNHCATCHGQTGHGNGPMANVLSVMPTDLTRLAAASGGVFPTDRVVRRVDGSDLILAHGSPMPWWGMILEGPSGIILAPDGTEVVAAEAIIDVTAWLEEVQR